MVPEGTGFLEGVTLRRPLWDVDDDHNLVGRDYQAEPVVPMDKENQDDSLTSCRGDSSYAVKVEGHDICGLPALRQFCIDCDLNINVLFTIILTPLMSLTSCGNTSRITPT